MDQALDVDGSSLADALGVVAPAYGPVCNPQMPVMGWMLQRVRRSVRGIRHVELILEEPSVIRFDWKASTSSASNALRFNVLGASSVTDSLEIYGTTQWAEVEVAVPVG